MAGATISEVHVVAAHDGEAELRITLDFGNGGQSVVTLDEFATRALMTSCAATSAEQLIGVDWAHVRDALIAASGRFAEAAA
mgnify:FL=1|jgi:hypothetical protein